MIKWHKKHPQTTCWAIEKIAISRAIRAYLIIRFGNRHVIYNILLSLYKAVWGLRFDIRLIGTCLLCWVKYIASISILYTLNWSKLMNDTRKQFIDGVNCDKFVSHRYNNISYLANKQFAYYYITIYIVYFECNENADVCLRAHVHLVDLVILFVFCERDCF